MPGGLFEYVSGANYFSECLEWTGYAIACWSWAGFAMAVFTTMFLGTRALQHHRYAGRELGAQGSQVHHCVVGLGNKGHRYAIACWSWAGLRYCLHDHCMLVVGAMLG